MFFTYVDLRWGITESQTCDGETISICLREVRRPLPPIVSNVIVCPALTKKYFKIDIFIFDLNKNKGKNAETKFEINNWGGWFRINVIIE